MWQKLKTKFGRSNGTVKSAIQKFARRAMVKETVGASLELLDNNAGKAVLERLKIICVEDKFPQGSQYIKWFNEKIKKFKYQDEREKRQLICNAATKVARLESDRHVAYLAKVALHYASSYDTLNGLSDEEKLAVCIEKMILRLKKRKEMATPEDMREKNTLRMIKQKIFGHDSMNPIQLELWNTFTKAFFTENKTTSRLFLYTLVALKFHGVSYLPNQNIQNVKIVKTECIELPDFVYDKHTTEGKLMKRGLKHFLEIGAYINNPHKDIEKRVGTKRKAEQFYLEDEEKYGTRQTNSSAERKRARKVFMKPKYWKKKPILKIEPCQKPCGQKPPTWIIETCDERVFVKGPYDAKEKLLYQVKIDSMKWKYGIKPVGYKIEHVNNVYYLYSKVHDGRIMDPNKKYTDNQMMELTKILIFRGVNGCSDTHLRNIMILENGELLSVDEMTHKPRMGNIIDFFFSKKPKKEFLHTFINFILSNKEKVNNEFLKHGETLNSFNLEIFKN